MKSLSIFLLLFMLLGCQSEAKNTENDSLEANKPIPEIMPEVIQSDTPTVLPVYAWQTDYEVNTALCYAIPTPTDYQRVNAESGSFTEWLRFLPTLPKGSKVMYFNGQEKPYQSLHEVVINIDIGKQDLQQCADATMRLRAEYLYSNQQYPQIHFNFTNGDLADYAKWRTGYAIKIANNHLQWYASSKANSSYPSFKKYMKQVFMYAGTSSLSKEVKKVADFSDIQAGDLLIQGGFPGHAVMVMDVATHQETGKKIYLISQSYMPAQSIHILKNTDKPSLGAWYSAEDAQKEGIIRTPQWLFYPDDLSRFGE